MITVRITDITARIITVIRRIPIKLRTIISMIIMVKTDESSNSESKIFIR